MKLRDIVFAPNTLWLRKNAPRNRADLVKSWFQFYGRKMRIQYWPHQGQRECARRRARQPQKELAL
jgi:hypothetical protein